LLEVLVGAVLLATLAVTVLLGFSEHRRQLSFSEQRIAVTVELDRLLRDWSSQPKGVPRNAMGLVEPGRSWWWTTRVVQQRTVFGVPAVVVRIEVYEHRMPDARRLVSIEMVQAEETASPLVGDEARSDQAELIADRSRRVPASPGTRLSAVVAGNEPELNAEVP
jgi:hypothetical protein